MCKTGTICCLFDLVVTLMRGPTGGGNFPAAPHEPVIPSVKGNGASIIPESNIGVSPKLVEKLEQKASTRTAAGLAFIKAQRNRPQETENGGKSENEKVETELGKPATRETESATPTVREHGKVLSILGEGDEEEDEESPEHPTTPVKEMEKEVGGPSATGDADKNESIGRSRDDEQEEDDEVGDASAFAMAEGSLKKKKTGGKSKLRERKSQRK